jgi:drug/metabolite transporter (DMT)-like permease
MIIEILSKLASESLLSLYPIFVKNIGLPLSLQTWSRCFSYALISGIFIDYSFVFKTLFTYNGIALSFVTVLHIYFSYRGFELLESGVAYSIFYLYPIMILLMSGHKIQGVMLMAVLGVYLLASKETHFYDVDKGTGSIDKLGGSFDKRSGSFDKLGGTTNKGDLSTIEGVIMIALAAFTEAVIYFLVRDIKTLNNWNHIFISYFLGAILLSWYMLDDIRVMKLNGRLSMSLGINSLIGLVGYLLRFYAVSRLDTIVYAPLSYFGIVMSFIYGVFINGESIDFKQVIGAGLIIFSNLWINFIS